MTHPCQDFAERYSAAWCSQDPAQVAAFFAPNGVLTINGGPPHVGRAAVAASAKSFMTAFPDLMVSLRALDDVEGRVVYHWRLTGTNTGPGGTGRAVCIDGSEAWLLDGHGAIIDSIGTFDGAEYERQLRGGEVNHG